MKISKAYHKIYILHETITRKKGYSIKKAYKHFKSSIATVIIHEVFNILSVYQKNYWIRPLVLKDIGLYSNLFRIIKTYHMFSQFLTKIDLLLILEKKLNCLLHLLLRKVALLSYK